MKEKPNRAVEVTTVVSGHSIPLGHPEHFLQLFPITEAGPWVVIHQVPSPLAKSCPMGFIPLMFLGEGGSPTQSFRWQKFSRRE